MSLLSQGQFRD